MVERSEHGGAGDEGAPSAKKSAGPSRTVRAAARMDDSPSVSDARRSIPVEDARPSRFLGLGCLLTLAGFFGGGMIAVVFARIVDWFQRCKAPEGLPACNTFEYLLIGAVIGMVLLPSIAFWRLRRAAAARNRTRE
jgi:hypothetical protein